jgi:Ca-activated chloride channel homolog
MTLEHPDFLIVSAGILLLALLGTWSHFRRRRLLGRFLGSPPEHRRLSVTDLERVPLGRLLLLTVAVGSLALAAAGPALVPSESDDEAEVPKRSVLIALNVSASMQADDVLPNRLGRAVQFADQLVDHLDGDRVGLILFAGSPYTIAPPTRDHAALRHLLGGVTPTIASAHDPGTLLAAGLRQAREILTASAAGGEERIIVLIGDGDTRESEDDLRQAADSAREEGIRIHSVGVGTAEGAGMVMPEAPFQLGGVIRDAAGSPAISRLEESSLRAVAEVTGGRYIHSGDEEEVEALLGMFTLPAAPPSDLPLPRRDPAELIPWLILFAAVLLLTEGLLAYRSPWRLPATGGPRS